MNLHKKASIWMILPDLVALIFIVVMCFVYFFLFQSMDIHREETILAVADSNSLRASVLSYLRTPYNGDATVADVLIRGCADQSLFYALSQFTATLPLPSSLQLSITCASEQIPLRGEECTDSSFISLPSIDGYQTHTLYFCGDIS